MHYVPDPAKFVRGIVGRTRKSTSQGCQEANSKEFRLPLFSPRRLKASQENGVNESSFEEGMTSESVDDKEDDMYNENYVLDPRTDAYFQSFHKGLVNTVGFVGTRVMAWMVIDSDSLVHYDTRYHPGVKGLVGFTVDDAPCRHRERHRNMVKEVKGLLAEYDAKATFFVCSDHVPGHDEAMVDLLLDEHELGNHCARDRRYDLEEEAVFDDILMRSEAVCEDLRRRAELRRRRQLRNAATCCGTACRSSCFDFINMLTRRKPEEDLSQVERSPVRWFRAPHGALSSAMKTVLQHRGFTNVFGDAYANDAWITDAEWIAGTLLGHVSDGSILVIHMPEKGFREYNFKAMRLTLEGLAERGLKAVTLSTLRKAAQEQSADSQQEDSRNNSKSSTALVDDERAAHALHHYQTE